MKIITNFNYVDFYLCKIYKFLPKKLIFLTIKLLINLKIFSEKNKFIIRLRNFDHEIKIINYSILVP